ncbi:hypothetical protein [Paenibacillus sp. UNC451MF]|uniref:hypothetical protein n=1 Tax=Paenibacillus sp. UNC451MF TaxID=1449063 RepID=UPI00056BA49E|nr:hypothetical protein [Paenibacillus sp. UNC451MF]
MNHLTLPLGNQKLLVELTIKEAWALSAGTHYNEQPQLASNARKKVRESMETFLFPHNQKLEYHLLEM